MRPDFSPYEREAEFAIKAVARAGQLCLEIERGDDHDTWTKADRSPVTVADFASQALVTSMLEATLASDPLVAEEDSARLRDRAASLLLTIVRDRVARHVAGASDEAVLEWMDRGRGRPAERFWTLDPVDGTKGLLRGGQYAVALALIERGRVILGALACPHLDLGGQSRGAVMVAVRGQGAWAAPMENMAFIRLHVSRRSAPSAARALHSFEADHTDEVKLERILSLLRVRPQPIRMDSQAKYGLLAAGRGELMLRLIPPLRPDYCERIWDHAAGSIMVEEAGGMVTDLRGQALDFGSGRELSASLGVLASNGRIHAAALEAIRAAGADHRPEAASG